MASLFDKNCLTHSFRGALTIGALAVAMVAAPLLGGCASGNQPADDAADAAQTKDAASETVGASDDKTTADAEAAADDVTAADSEAVTDAVPQSAEVLAFSPSDGIDDDGHWAGVTALDYVTLPVYEGIEVPVENIAVTDDDIQAQVDAILSDYVTYEQVTDRAVADGDTVNIDYVGSIDGVEFDGGSTGGMGTQVTIGVTQYIDDFLEQLIGHMPGENFDIEVTFPDDYHAEDLAGKDAVFNITINYISQSVIPEATDEFVSSTFEQSYGWTSVDQMRSEIAAGLSSQLLDQYVQSVVFDSSEVSEIPQNMIEYQEASMADYYTQYAASFGVSVEELLPMLTGMSSLDELIESDRDQINDAARSCLIVQAVAEDAGIAVNDDGVTAYFSAAMGIDDIDPYIEEYGMPYLKLVTLSDAVIDFLATHAVVVGEDADGVDPADIAEAADGAEAVDGAEATDDGAEVVDDAGSSDAA